VLNAEDVIFSFQLLFCRPQDSAVRGRLHQPPPPPRYDLNTEFYVFLTVYLITIFVNNKLDAQFFFLIFVYSNSLHVSSNQVLIIRRVNCISTTSGICQST